MLARPFREGEQQFAKTASRVGEQVPRGAGADDLGLNQLREPAREDTGTDVRAAGPKDPKGCRLVPQLPKNPQSPAAAEQTNHGTRPGF